MVEAGLAPRFSPSSTSIASQFLDFNTKPIAIRAGLLLHAVTKFKSLQPIRIHSQFHQRPSTYSSRMSTDIPFYETPGASFDQYLEDKPRVFTAIFPDKRRSQQLNEVKAREVGEMEFVPADKFGLVYKTYPRGELTTHKADEEEWRVHMLPIQFFFLTVSPVVDMRLRCKTNGKDYPSGISPAISKVLELDIIRWELQGLDNVVPPDHFSLGVQGALYSDRRGTRSRLKGQLEMKISVVTPPVLVLVPEDVRRNVSESVLKTLLENMKDKVNGNLLADYSKFRRERQVKPV